MDYIVLIGPPGSGKGTQGARLCARYGLVHVSTGDIMRAEAGSGSALGEQIASYVNAGLLVPSEVVIGAVRKHLSSLPSDVSGVVLDGYPRTQDQAVALEEDLNASANRLLVCAIEVSEAALVARLFARGRLDDSAVVIQKRLAVYQDQTRPLLAHYGAQAHRIVGEGSEEAIFAHFEALIARLWGR